MVHIHDCLPSLQRRIGVLQEKTRQQLSSFGDVLPGDQNKEVFVRNMLLNFEKRFRALIEGGARGAGGDAASAELVGGARVNFIFHEVYARALAEVDPLQGITAEKVRLSFRNSSGQNSSIFIPETTFENLVKPQIARLKGPSLECSELVFQELTRMVHQARPRRRPRAPPASAARER
jgi:dynamin 1-like protein